MKCVSTLPIGLLCCILLLESGLCRPQKDVDEEEQNDANDEEFNDEVRGNVPPPVITTRPQNIAKKIGDKVTLPCEVNNLGDFTLMWSNGTQPLFLGSFNYVKDEKRIYKEGNSLVIADLTAADSATYTCKILVSKDDTPSVSHKLSVKNHMVPDVPDPDPTNPPPAGSSGVATTSIVLLLVTLVTSLRC